MTAPVPLSRTIEAGAPNAPVAQFLTIGEPTERPGIYQLRTLGLAAVFEIGRYAIAGVEPEELERAAQSIGQSIATSMDVPDAEIRTSFSVTAYKSHDITSDLAMYKQPEGVHEILTLLRQKHIESLVRGTTEPVLGGAEDGLYIGSYRMIGSITIHPRTMPGGGSSRSILDAAQDFLRSVGGFFGMKPTNDEGLTPIEEPFVAVRNMLSENLGKIIAGVADTLGTEGLSTRPLAPAEYLGVMRDLLHPRMSRGNQPSYDPSRPLADQVALNDLLIDTNSSRGCVNTGDAVLCCSTLQASPQESFPAILTRPNRRIGGRSVIHGLQHGFLTVSGFLEDQPEIDRFLELREGKLNGTMTPPALRSELLPDVHEAQRYRNSGGRLMSMMVTAVSHGKNFDEARTRAEGAQRLLTRIRSEFRVERSAGPQFIFQALPANAILPISGMKGGSHRRNRLVYDKNLSEFFPWWHFGRGLQGPEIKSALTLLPNRHGELGAISLNGSAVKHAFIIGQTGSGKSFFAHKLKDDFLCDPNAQVIILDYLNSYGFAVGQLGDQGAVYNLGGKNRSTLNPFEGTLREVREIAPTTIKLLATGGVDELSQSSVGLIEDILNRAFQENQDTVTFQDFEDLIPKEAVGLYVDYARKRLLAKFISPETLTNLEALRRNTEGRETVFEIQFRYVVRSFTSSETKHTNAATSASKAPKEFLDLFQAKGCELLDDADGTVILLGGTPDLERVFRSRGVDLELDRETCFVDVEQRTDAVTVAQFGVEFIPPPGLLAEYRGEIAAQIAADPTYASSSADQVQALAADRARALPPDRIYDSLTGMAVLQSLVTFNDWGRILDAMATANTEGAADLQKRLNAYYGRGVKSAYFDGPTAFDLSKRLISFELDGLDADKHLKSVTISVLLHVLTQHFKTPGQRGKPRMLLIEEIHRHWADPVVGKELSIVWREGRKLGFAAIGVTQTFAEFGDNPIARSLLAQSPNRFLFYQEDSPETMAAATKLLGLKPAEIEWFRSISYKKGVYSEFLWQHSQRELGVLEAFLFLPSPYHYWASTTDPADTMLRTRLYLEAGARNGANGTKRQTDAQIRRQVIESLVRGARPGNVEFKSDQVPPTVAVDTTADQQVADDEPALAGA